MSDEKLEQIVSAIEAAFVFAGATDFDDGLVTAKKLIAPFYESLQCLETRADLKAALAACDEATSGELAKVLVLMQNLPSVTRFGFTSLAKAAAATLPPLPSGRPSSVPSTAVAAFFYDSSTLSGTAYTAGRLTSEETLNTGSAISERYTYAYDALGRLRSEKQCPMGTCFVPALITCSDGVQVASYCYDEAGNLYNSNNMLSGSNSVAFSYNYDSGGRLTSQTSTPNSGSPTTLFQSGSYGAAGLYGGYLGGSSTPAVTMSRTYDRRFRVLSESDTGMTPSGSAVIYSYSVPSSGGYAANGNLSNFADSIVGTWSMSGGYDTLNRLTAVHSTSGPYSGGYGCWTYDAFGNRQLEAYSNVTSTPCSNGANDNLQSTSTPPTASNQVSGLQYDVAGNVLYDGSNHYAYDPEGRLCAVSYNHIGSTQYSQYVYDAEGRRIAKGSASNLNCSVPSGFAATNLYLLGLGGGQVTETNGSASALHSNAWMGGRPLATFDFANGGLHYVLTDWLGTKRVQVAGSGTKIGYAELDCFSLPFGNDFGNSLIPNCTTPSGSPVAADATENHFTGKERDAESGNDYFGARYFSSSLGRFMSPDWSVKVEPIPYSRLDNPQSMNLYAYVRNNPFNQTDPDGHNAYNDWAEQNQADIVSWGGYVMNYQPNLDAEQNMAQQQTNDGTVSVVVHGGGGHWWNKLGSWLSNGFASLSAVFSRSLGTFGGPRAGKPFTPAGRQAVLNRNAAENGGTNACENCGQPTIPGQQSQAGVPRPGNESNVDHIYPRALGGDGDPINGQNLCATCNGIKSNSLPVMEEPEVMPEILIEIPIIP